MERANPATLILCLLGITIVFGAPTFLQDGLYLAKHEGDVVHLLDILLRMYEGQIPHLEILTPIGSMAFWPIVWLMGPETGPGQAILYAQLVLLLLLMPAVFWVGVSRLSTLQAALFGLIIAALVTALVHGQTEPTLSVSMHYNRWAWALAFLALTIAILPTRGVQSQVLDGIIVGTCFAFLALLKVTYVAGFIVPVAIAFIVHRHWVSLAMAAVSGLVALGIYTVFVGVDYWFVYLGDILTVSGSEVRPQPGHPLSGVIGAPAYLGASLIVFASVIFLRQSKAMEAGLILLLSVPGFFFVTYQNFGNDPQWIYLLPIFLFALRPRQPVRNGFGWDMGRAITYSAIVSMSLAAPSFLNLAYSPFRHAVVDPEGYKSLLRDEGPRGDIFAPAARAYRVHHTFDQTGEGELFAGYYEEIEKHPDPLIINDEVMPNCSLSNGFIGYFDQFAKSLDEAGYTGEKIMQADVFSSAHWLYGDFPPVRGGAPWSYGTEAGLVDSDYLLVPFCPLAKDMRKFIYDAIAKHEEIALTEVFRNELFLMLQITKP